MRKTALVSILLALGFAFSQSPVSIKSRKPVFCGQFKNSYGYSGKSTGTSIAPWKFWADSVFIDTTGTGQYKKLGVTVDTTQAVYVQGALGFYAFAGSRTNLNSDSGAFGIRPQCWNPIARAWVNGKNMACDTLNLKCDTAVATAASAGGFSIDRTLPSICDSLRTLVYSVGVTGRSLGDSTYLTQFGACVY